MLVIKKSWVRAALACVILTMVVVGIIFYRAVTKVEPVPLIQKAAQQAQQADCYRYRVNADFNISGKIQNWIRVEGEKASPTDSHFKGKVLGTPVEIFQTGTRSYTLEPVSKKWVMLEGSDLSQQQIYMAELNPLSNFKFKAINTPKLLKPEKINGRKCFVVEFKPEVENKLMEMWWKDFTYRFWVDARSRTLTKASATAINRNSPSTKLTLTATFQDYGKRIDLKLPD